MIAFFRVRKFVFSPKRCVQVLPSMGKNHSKNWTGKYSSFQPVAFSVLDPSNNTNTRILDGNFSLSQPFHDHGWSFFPSHGRRNFFGPWRTSNSIDSTFSVIFITKNQHRKWMDTFVCCFGCSRFDIFRCLYQSTNMDVIDDHKIRGRIG